MKSQTSLVASQVRLREWAIQIRECQNRPDGMDVQTWCTQNNITKANYYYRLRRVREACMEMTGLEKLPDFVQLEEPVCSADACDNRMPPATLMFGNNLCIELHSNATQDFLVNLLGAIRHAE